MEFKTPTELEEEALRELMNGNPAIKLLKAKSESEKKDLFKKQIRYYDGDKKAFAQTSFDSALVLLGDGGRTSNADMRRLGEAAGLQKSELDTWMGAREQAKNCSLM